MKFLPKFKSPTLKFTVRFLYFFVALIAIALFSYLGFFLYKYIYLTFGISENIVFLRNEIAPDSIDMTKVDEVLDYLNKKGAKNELDAGRIKNPFLPLSAPPEAPQISETSTSTTN